ncbi:hypothetical protein BGZ61DRAFT_448025 [Ilyonectria robusta]|uniref:uncharacterized protein n=1 Tax=Ilyonectria robusta TaxID=1079257 RepID=UPI001E8E8D01|nr:uncharacterized protein BGZ61DRAFT_448025 [Ilyonectria robusta]KAH8722118.1 hypothetical protein BGZ61DRAFT_448025 [Ilyonectria robusta]
MALSSIHACNHKKQTERTSIRLMRRENPFTYPLLLLHHPPSPVSVCLPLPIPAFMLSQTPKSRRKKEPPAFHGIFLCASSSSSFPSFSFLSCSCFHCMHVCVLLLSSLLLAFSHRNAWHEFVQKKYSLSRERTSSSREHRLSFPSPFFLPLIIVKALRCVRRTLITERREQKKVTFPRTTQREQHKKIIR